MKTSLFSVFLLCNILAVGALCAREATGNLQPKAGITRNVLVDCEGKKCDVDTFV